MIDKEKHGLTIQVDDQGQEWINGTSITNWDKNLKPRHRGKFIKGVASWAQGCPKYDKDSQRAKVMIASLSFSLEGIEILKGFARDEKERTPTRIKAIEVIFDRGLGRVQETREQQLSADELVNSLPDIFFPNGQRPDEE